MINSTAKSKAKKYFMRALLLAICLTLAVPYLPSSEGVYAAEKDISSRIKACEEALEDAAAELKSANITYDKAKAKATATVSVTDKDLALVGREFIEDLVATCYEKDKKDESADTVLALDKLTIAGHIKKAKNNAACKKIVDSINAQTTKSSKKFKAIINQSLSIDNINIALDYIDRCNELRAKHGKNAYKVSPYLMAGAPISAAISGKSAHLYINQNLFKTYDDTKVYENFCWAYSPTYDPFGAWYDSEKASEGPHFRAIVSSNYKQTGFNWIPSNYDGKMIAVQCFTKDSGGVSYTTDKFRTLFNEFISIRKKEILQEKINNLDIFKNKPDYVVDAETKYNNALKKLKDTVKSYTPEFSVSNYSYNTLKINYTIPDGYDAINIFRSKTGKDGSFKKIVTKTSGTSYKDTNLTCGTRYYYKVRLYKKINKVKVRCAPSAKHYRTAVPSKVKNVSAVINENGFLDITWTEIKGAQKYEIYAKKIEEESFAKLEEGKAVTGLVLDLPDYPPTLASVLSLENDVNTYVIKVRAVRTVNGSPVLGAFSNEITVEY
ncbi:MAG: CAP domain-containing protein [Firmicutes bacterium]|nr:CAP domain-containing protein [Bacillota bacterium]